MTAANGTIVSLYEDNGLTPEEISEATGYALSAVKATLLSFSSKFYALTKTEVKSRLENSSDVENVPIVSETEFEQVKQALINLALYPEDNVGFGVRFKALRYLVDDRKGRLDKKAANIRNTRINITLINNELKNIRKLKEDILEVQSEKVS